LAENPGKQHNSCGTQISKFTIRVDKTSTVKFKIKFTTCVNKTTGTEISKFTTGYTSGLVGLKIKNYNPGRQHITSRTNI
jgi:hypothetical protein